MCIITYVCSYFILCVYTLALLPALLQHHVGDDTDGGQVGVAKGQSSCSGDEVVGESVSHDWNLKITTESSDKGGDMEGKVEEDQQTVGYLATSATVQSRSSEVAGGANKLTRAPPEQVAGCSESLGSEQQNIWRQIEALNRPCYVQFSCMARLSSSTQQQDKDGLSPPGSKRARLVETTAAAHSPSEQTVELIFEWIQGDNKDLLHQIVQYLNNSTFQHQVAHSDNIK